MDYYLHYFSTFLPSLSAFLPFDMEIPSSPSPRTDGWFSRLGFSLPLTTLPCLLLVDFERAREHFVVFHC